MSSLFTSLELNSLDDLFVFELQDLYDAEKRICDALPKMADACRSSQLKQALMSHLDESKQQVLRLEDCFHRMGREPDSTTCEGVKGIISEGDTICDAKGDPDVKDAAIIGAAQRVEHYEIAAYGTCRAFAEQLGRNDIANLLQRTLDEEGEADKKLTSIAESMVNVRAKH